MTTKKSVTCFQLQSTEGLTREILRFGRLRKLLLIGQGLTSLPDFLGELAHLEVLRATYNNFQKVPPVLGKLPSLMILDLTGCALETFSDLSHLSLVQLDLGANKIKELGSRILFPDSLVSLNLMKNQLSVIPSWVFELKNLKSLYLSGNPLEKEQVEQWKKQFPHLHITF